MVKRQNEIVRAIPQHGRNALDIECVRRIAAGDAESVGELYDRHATAMYSLACRILDSEEDAGDVVQEVFVYVWREAGRDEASRGIVAAWLLMLIRNRAIGRLRVSRAAAGVSGPGDGGAWRPPAPRADRPPSATPEYEASERVRDALHTLPVLHRVAIEMTYFEGLSHEEIASSLEQPVAAVRTRIGTALLKLRAALAREGR